VDLFVRTGRFLYLYWTMTALQIIEKKGRDAIKELRLQKLRDGYPFMINSDDLEPRQCYFEFPDGTIQLAYLQNSAREFTMIRKLSAAEAEALREKYAFTLL
jgi:hypothetical protein